MQDWADANDLKEVTLLWLMRRNAEVTRLCGALCRAEEWTERPSDAHFVASSGPELARLSTTALESLADLDIPLHGAVVRSELQNVGRMVREYAKCASAGCEDPAALVRPAPPLTRYKQSLSEKAMAGKDVAKCALLHASASERACMDVVAFQKDTWHAHQHSDSSISTSHSTDCSNQHFTLSDCHQRHMHL